MKTRLISDDDQCGGCKYRIMAGTPDTGDRCVHGFAGVTEEDEDGTIKTCSDFTRPTRVLIVGEGHMKSIAVTALEVVEFDIVVEAEPVVIGGLASAITFFDEPTSVKHPPRLGMTTPKFYGRDEDGILAQHQQRWLMQIRDLESAQPQCHEPDPLAALRAEPLPSVIRELSEVEWAAIKRRTGMRPEHGMPYGNPLGPQLMKPKPNKAKARAKKRARIAAQSRRHNRTKT